MHLCTLDMPTSHDVFLLFYTCISVLLHLPNVEVSRQHLFMLIAINHGNEQPDLLFFVGELHRKTGESVNSWRRNKELLANEEKQGTPK